MTTKAIVDALVAEVAAGFVQAKTAAAAKPPDLAGMQLGFLKASNAANRLAALVPVDGVQPPPPPPPLVVQTIDSFTATPLSVKPGDEVTFAWSTSNAGLVFLKGPSLDESVMGTGTFKVKPTASGTYTLTARGAGPDVSRPVSVTVQAVTSPADPPPANVPPIPVSGKVPAFGASSLNQQHNFGPADWVDITKLPAPMPWTFARTLAPSQNGVAPTKWIAMHQRGAHRHLYGSVPTVKNNRIVQYYGTGVVSGPLNHNDDVVGAGVALKANPPPVGVRGASVDDPFVAWRGHPAAGGPLWMGVRADGAFMAELPDGSNYIMGWVKGVTEPLDWGVGSSGLKFLVADSGRIIQVDRTAAHAARVAPAREDGNLWTQTDLAIGLGRVTGMAVMADGTVYAADNTGGRILKITAAGVVSVLCSLPGAFAMDATSTGKLVVVDSINTGVFIVDPATGSVSPDLMPANRHAFLAFGTVSVDRNGTIGPKDNFLVSRSHGQANGNEHFHFSQTAYLGAAPFGGSDGAAVIGDMAHGYEAYHYPWTLAIHPIFALVRVQGMGNVIGQTFRPAMAGDVDEDRYDHYLYLRGVGILKTGSIATSPPGLRPSFTALMNLSGWSNLGCTADFMAEKSYADLAAFIQGGMIGSVPRPEIVGADLLAVGYVILRCSQRFLREGAALIDGWRGFIGPVPATNPNTDIAWEPPPSSSLYMVADKAMVQLVDNNGNSHPFAAGTTIRVIADQGTSAERDLGIVAAPYTMPTFSLAPGPHALSCKMQSGGAPNYYSSANTIEM